MQGDEAGTRERERERERKKKIERAHVPVRSCAPAESAPSSLVSCWYCAIRRMAVTNSHEIRIVVREMAAITSTSGRRKQSLSPLFSSHNPQKQLTTPRFEVAPLSLSLPTQNGTKTKCSPFQLLCCTVHGTVLDVANTDSQNLSPLQHWHNTAFKLMQTLLLHAPDGCSRPMRRSLPAQCAAPGRTRSLADKRSDLIQGK